MDLSGRPAVRRLLERARRDPDVLGVMLFGSHARGEATEASDVDVCLLLFPGRVQPPAATEKKLDYLADAAAGLDLAIFQELPLYVRTRVLKEGRVLFAADEDALYDLAIRTAKAWEDFRPIYRRYLDEVARG
jgi:predicted nucleotidyltransferase